VRRVGKAICHLPHDISLHILPLERSLSMRVFDVESGRRLSSTLSAPASIKSYRMVVVRPNCIHAGGFGSLDSDDRVLENDRPGWRAPAFAAAIKNTEGRACRA